MSKEYEKGFEEGRKFERTWQDNGLSKWEAEANRLLTEVERLRAENEEYRAFQNKAAEINERLRDSCNTRSHRAWREDLQAENERLRHAIELRDEENRRLLAELGKTQHNFDVLNEWSLKHQNINGCRPE